MQAVDEERLHTVLQRVANRVTLGIVIAATMLGAALMMRVPTDHRILGYPAIAMFFFPFAVLAGAALARLDRAHRPQGRPSRGRPGKPPRAGRLTG